MPKPDITIMSQKIADALPENVRMNFAAIDDSQEQLFESELVHVYGSVPNRVREFTAGRTCARRVLSQLGISPCAIPSGTMREPIWPSLLTGSISHDGDHCVACAANKGHISLLGIDLTMCAPLDEDLIPIICTNSDIRGVKELDNATWGLDPYKLIFSIKESAYKCLFPVVQQFFDFNEIDVLLVPNLHSASIRLLNAHIFSSVNAQLSVRYCATGPYIFSIVWANELHTGY